MNTITTYFDQSTKEKNLHAELVSAKSLRKLSHALMGVGCTHFGTKESADGETWTEWYIFPRKNLFTADSNGELSILVRKPMDILKEINDDSNYGEETIVGWGADCTGKQICFGMSSVLSKTRVLIKVRYGVDV